MQIIISYIPKARKLRPRPHKVRNIIGSQGLLKAAKTPTARMSNVFLGLNEKSTVDIYVEIWSSTNPMVT